MTANDTKTLEIMIPLCEGCHRGSEVMGYMSFTNLERIVVGLDIETWRNVRAGTAHERLVVVQNMLMSNPMEHIERFRMSSNRPYDELMWSLNNFIKALEQYPQGTVYNAEFRPEVNV